VSNGPKTHPLADRSPNADLSHQLDTGGDLLRVPVPVAVQSPCFLGGRGKIWGSLTSSLSENGCRDVIDYNLTTAVLSVSTRAFGFRCVVSLREREGDGARLPFHPVDVPLLDRNAFLGMY
jgi:hypothetical protein